MSDVVIKVENLSKKYIISHQGQEKYTALRDVLANGVRSMFNRGIVDPLKRLSSKSTTQQLNASSIQPLNDSTEDFYALKDISFEIKQGDRVGIIGRNGAGKSTLLKILSRITEPTSGRIEITGRVASLLEVGTGFHPELTGRENIFLNGAILGMGKVEINRKFDEIVEFAEVERFLDTPVKRYSSGMYVRLAFAVAAHLEPEILIVDEVLAVGDAQFQKKCLGKMGEVSKEGRTVLFVSHNMEAIRRLCNRGILMEKGQVVSAGNTESVINGYLESGITNQSEFLIAPPKDPDVNGFAYKIIVEDFEGSPANEILMGQPWQVRILFKINKKTEHFIIGLGMLTNLSFRVRTVWSKPVTLEPGDYQAIFRENSLQLTTGRYLLLIGLSAHERTFHYVEDAGFLKIAEFSDGLDIPRVDCGLILNQLQVVIERSSSQR